MSARANVVGSGLIGGSIAAGLTTRGWTVSISDHVAARAVDAVGRGFAAHAGVDADASVTFVAVPVGEVVTAARHALDHTEGAVTDVGSVKHRITRAIAHPRFVGGHPMAGSEQDGLDGADPDMFQGAAWVLAPGEETADETFATVSAVVRDLGADLITMDAARHDELVALVSHVPHLAAVTLMGLADTRASDHRALLRMAAGGFRDMTRIAAGHPGIWPDICRENSQAIVDTLDRYIDQLRALRAVVGGHDDATLIDTLETARRARINLPTSAPASDDLVEVRVPVLDQRGEVSIVATLATDLDVNLFDIEIAHSTEGARGVITLLVERSSGARLVDALRDRGYRPSTHDL